MFPMLEIGIWMVLAILGYFTLHAVIERVIFHSYHRAAPADVLDDFTEKLEKFRSVAFCKKLNHNKSWLLPKGDSVAESHGLGWLGILIIKADGVRKDLKKLVYGYQKVVGRFSGFLATMVPVGGYVGLLGTVMAFASMTGGTDNYAHLMPLAFQTTLVGLIISTPAAMVYGLLSPRAELILDQTNLVLDAIDSANGTDSDDGASSTDVVSADVLMSLSEFPTAIREFTALQTRMTSLLDDLIATSLCHPESDDVQREKLDAGDEGDGSQDKGANNASS